MCRVLNASCSISVGGESLGSFWDFICLCTDEVPIRADVRATLDGLFMVSIHDRTHQILNLAQLHEHDIELDYHAQGIGKIDMGYERHGATVA